LNNPPTTYTYTLSLHDALPICRIQPAKIEKIVEQAQADINKTIKEKGEQAAYECGVIGLDQRILLILGRLHFRTSYGQNVLRHSDRKSTRLNSSHLGISYAVFC